MYDMVGKEMVSIFGNFTQTERFHTGQKHIFAGLTPRQPVVVFD